MHRKSLNFLPFLWNVRYFSVYFCSDIWRCSSDDRSFSKPAEAENWNLQKGKCRRLSGKPSGALGTRCRNRKGPQTGQSLKMLAMQLKGGHYFFPAESVILIFYLLFYVEGILFPTYTKVGWRAKWKLMSVIFLTYILGESSGQPVCIWLKRCITVSFPISLLGAGWRSFRKYQVWPEWKKDKLYN